MALGGGVAFAHHWEPMIEGCSLQTGPRGGRQKANVYSSTFTMLGSPGSPGSPVLAFSLQLSISAGMFI